MLVDAWLPRAAAAAPSAIALQAPERSCTYAELLGLARAGAAELTARGVSPGDPVAIALPPGVAFAVALHACLLLGAIAVPVDLRMNEAERAQIAAPGSLVLDEPLPERPRRATGRSGPVGAHPDEAIRHDLTKTAAIIHTSGTTSAPKPVELTYGNFLWSAFGSAVALGLDPAERWLCALPVSHVGGLSILLRSAIYNTTAVVHERFETERVLACLERERITLVSVVATTLTRLLDAGLERPGALRCALAGGGPVPAALLERAHAAGVPVSTTYGLTESCSQATTRPMLAEATEPTAAAEATKAAEDPNNPGALDPGFPDAGPPLFCTRLRIAPDGEILLAGPTVAPGAIAADGWLHTGDLGSLAPGGGLRVTGRKSDTIVSGGENVAPIEVEGILEAHPAVLEAAVLGRPDPQWGEAVTAIVVARSGHRIDAETLREHCAERLARYKVPKQIVLVGEPLPRTRSGKLLRGELASYL